MSDLRNHIAFVRERDELIARSTMVYWWQRRYYILKVLAGLAVLYGVILLLIPARFRAEASVIIMPPRYAPEVRTAPLTVPTAQAIMETKELYQQVLTTLRRNRQLLVKILGNEKPTLELAGKLDGMTAGDIVAASGGSQAEAAALKALEVGDILGVLEFDEEELANLNVDAVGQMLTSAESVDKKTASDLVYSPVIRLFAVSDTGYKAQALANTWAGLFEKKYEMLTRGQTQRLNTSLELQQNTGREELEKVQQELVDFRLSHNLQLLERQIRDFTDLISTFSQQLSGRRHEYSVLDEKVRTYTATLGELENGEHGWIGNVNFAGGYEEKTADDGRTTGSGLLLTQSRDSRKVYAQALSELDNLYQETPVEYLSSQEKEFRTQLVVEKREMREGKVRIKALEDAVNETERELAATTGVLTLSTALPDEVLGNAVISGGSGAVKNLGVKFEREIVNPLWESLIQRRSDLQKELVQEKSRIAVYEEMMPTHEAELNQLIGKVATVNRTEAILKQRAERAEKINSQMFQKYQEAQNELVESSVRLEFLGNEIKSIEDTIRQLTEKLDLRRAEFETASSQEGLMQLRIKAVESQASVLTQKLQEAAVAVGEQVSDVSIAARAVAPARHFFPPRTILFLASLFLSAVVLLGLMARSRYYELYQERHPSV